MVEIFKCDFDPEADFSHWTNTSGTPTIVNSPVHHGSSAFLENALNECCRKTFSEATEIYVGFNVRFSVIGNEDGISEIGMLSDNYTPVVGPIIRNPYTGTTYFGISDSASYWMSDVAPVINTDYYLVYGYKKDVNGFYKLWINGTLKVNQAVNTSALGTPDKVMVGNDGNWAAQSFTACFDCINVDSASFTTDPFSSGVTYSPKTRSSLPNTMVTMLNSKMLFG
jgi:hypothetical protein